ncbi:MAG: D-alanine--D-alanine ligase family protein [Bacteroidia bacterium]
MLQLALLLGGRSPEHEISLLSARNILEALDKTKYAVTCIGIDLDGAWRLLDHENWGERVSTAAPELALVPGRKGARIRRVDDGAFLPDFDIVFPITHGPGGEDGTLQGLLRMLDYPFVGPDVLGSSVAMDKDVAKRLLQAAGLQVAPWECFQTHEADSVDFASLANKLGTPLFVKPANMGSSVGVHKVSTAAELKAAVHDAFRFDRKIVIEAMIHGRELECAVLGNVNPDVTSVGEVVIVSEEEYSYEAKYQSADAAQIVIPAELENNNLAALQIIARQAYIALCCEGLSRVDMFLTEEGDIYVNEINTLPGFTNISMYPKLWDHSELDNTALLDRLIQLAIARHEERNALVSRLND